MDNSGGYHVNPHPCRFSGFTFDKAIKLQCIGEQYLPVAPDSAESDYLIKLAAEAFQLGKCVIDDAGFTAQLIMEAVLQQIEVLGPAQVFRVHYVNFGQLQPVRGAPNIAERPPPKDGPSYVPAEHFEEYTATEAREKRGPGGETVSHDVNYVQAPITEGGHHYEVKNVRFWPWTMQLCVKLNLAGFNLDKEGDELPDGEVREYAAHLKLASRTLAHMHYGDDNVPGTKRGSLVSKNHQQQCVQLSVGDLDHVQCESGQAHVNKFMPWDMVPDAVGLPGMLSSIMLLEGEARRVRQGIKVPLVE